MRPRASLPAAAMCLLRLASGDMIELDSSTAIKHLLPRKRRDMRERSSSLRLWNASTFTTYTLGFLDSRNDSKARTLLRVALPSQARTEYSMLACFGSSSSVHVDIRLLGEMTTRVSTTFFTMSTVHVSMVVFVFPVPISINNAWNP